MLLLIFRKTGSAVVLLMILVSLWLRPGPRSDTPVHTARAAGATAYAIQSEGDDRLYEIDLATGEARPIGSGVGMPDVETLALSLENVLYGVDDETDQLVTCDLAAGRCSPVGPLGIDVYDVGLTFDVYGRLWLSVRETATFYRVDPQSGSVRLVGSTGQPVIALAAWGAAIFGISRGPNNQLVTIDPTTGASTLVGRLGTVSIQDGGLDFDADGILYGVNYSVGGTRSDDDDGQEQPSEIFTIDLATGAASPPTVITVNGSPAGGYEGLVIPSATPKGGPYWAAKWTSPMSSCTYFPETGHNLCAGFRQYWLTFGGVAVHGLPLTEEFVDEQGRTVQYFERSRFEWHPGQWPERFDVTLGLLSNELIAGRWQEAPFQPIPGAISANCTYFPETRQHVCGGFRAFWERFGGLAVYGYPKSAEFRETNPDTGVEYTVQYFERARFEWHPGEWPERFDVMLGRLGAQVLAQRYGVDWYEVQV